MQYESKASECFLNLLFVHLMHVCLCLPITVCVCVCAFVCVSVCLSTALNIVCLLHWKHLTFCSHDIAACS